MNLLSLLEDRSGEKLVQALILYASKDPDFRNAFCELFGFPCDPETFNEEIAEEDLRYDLVLDWKKGTSQQRHVELKLWADFTSGQMIDLREGDKIHGVILPTSRQYEIDSLNPSGDVKVCTWEQFLSKIANSTATASILFHDLLEYVGKNTIKVSTIRKAMRQFTTDDWSWHNAWGEMYRYLRIIKAILPGIDESIYSTARKGSIKDWYYGFRAYSGKHDGWIWVGFVSVVQDERESGEVGLYAQASRKMNELLHWPEIQSHWWWSTGYAVQEIKTNGIEWTLSSIKKQLQDLLQPLANLPTKDDA